MVHSSSSVVLPLLLAERQALGDNIILSFSSVISLMLLSILSSFVTFCHNNNSLFYTTNIAYSLYFSLDKSPQVLIFFKLSSKLACFIYLAETIVGTA